MAKQWGYHIPTDVRIYCIEVKELSKFSQGFTPEITEKLHEIVEYVLGNLAGN